MSGTQRRGGGAGGERRGRDNRRGQNDRNRNQNEYLERVVAINRVAKVVPVSYTHLTLPTKRIV